MERKIAFLFILSGLFIYQPPSFGESKTNTPAQLKQRRVASLDRVAPTNTAKVSRSLNEEERKPFSLILGLLVGLSKNARSSVAPDLFDNSSDASSQPQIGLLGDFRAIRYLGAELDGFYSLTGTTDATTASRKTTIGFLGASFAVKGQAPIDINDSFQFCPKVGAGIGLLREKSKSEEDGVTTDRSSQMNYPFFLAGFDFTFLRNWKLEADYAKSVGAKGKTNLTQSESNSQADVDMNASETKTDKIRVGLSYRFTSRFLIGLEYVRRTMIYSAPFAADTGLNGSLSIDNRFNQYLAKFFFEL